VWVGGSRSDERSHEIINIFGAPGVLFPRVAFWVGCTTS
jgi:hypothetical protein